MSHIDQAYHLSKKEAKKNLKKIRKHLQADPGHFDNEWRGLLQHALLEEKPDDEETMEKITKTNEEAIEMAMAERDRNIAKNKALRE